MAGGDPALKRDTERGAPPLETGRNCWRIAEAGRVRALVDAAEYYGRLREALLAARDTVFIAGWDVDSRTPLVGPDRSLEDGAPERLRELLEYLVRRRGDLRVHVLLWDWSLLYAAEREPWPTLNLDWRTPRRVRVCLDDALPLGAAHHSKIVVVDDRLAFCGGLDLTTRRWDTPEHTVHSPERRDAGGEPYGPFHDVQLMVDGEAAAALGELVRERWRRAGGARLFRPRPSDVAWPDAVEPDLRGVRLAIARTAPAYDGQPEVREIRDAYLEAIARAERYVYIENQYATAMEIAEALARRMAEVPALELVVIGPRLPRGWLEAASMGAGRQQFIARFRDERLAARTRFLYPWHGEGPEEAEAQILVHSKLLIVDGAWLQVGSANLNRRSMSLDTECDLVVMARDETECRGVERVLHRLLAEHLGTNPGRVADALADQGSLIGAIEGLGSPGRALRPLEPPAGTDALSSVLYQVADRESPLSPETFLGDMFAARNLRPLMRRGLKLGAAVAGIVALALAVAYAPLEQLSEPRWLAGQVRGLVESDWLIPAILALFLVGGQLMLPVTAMMTLSGLLLGPKLGFFCAVAGTLGGAAIGHQIGLHVPGPRLRGRWARWFRRVSRFVTRRGVVSVAILRIAPVAPFAVVNFALGALRVRFRDYMLGTVLGHVPIIAVLTLVGDRLRVAWQEPELHNYVALALAGLAWLGLALGLQKLASRMEER